jgi:hypothetical protein
MNKEIAVLSDRDVYLLGVLAERNDIIKSAPDRLPRGCGDANIKALLQMGYATETAYRAADGSDVRRYQITRKGSDAWRAFRFIN